MHTPRVSSNLHTLQHQRLPRMRHTAPPHLNLRMPLHHISRHLDIEIQNHACKNHLDLVRGEKAPGASMASIAESEVRFVGGDELVTSVVSCGTTLTQLVVAEAIKSRTVGVVLWVGVDCVGGDFDYHAGWDVLAV